MCDDQQDTYVYYLTEITRVNDDEDTVDLKYVDPYDEVEIGVDVDRITALVKARALRDLNQTLWERILKRVAADIGPQPNYITRSKRDNLLLYLYTHEQT